ncbi:hypothetical protein BpHYR1_020348, partial [Brachionus plicatilis]
NDDQFLTSLHEAYLNNKGIVQKNSTQSVQKSQNKTKSCKYKSTTSQNGNNQKIKK